MIEFSFAFSPLTVKFKNLWNRAWPTPFKHKSIELELYTTEAVIGFGFSWTCCRDHAGVDVQLSAFGICVHFDFYDNRHWDSSTHNWVN